MLTAADFIALPYTPDLTEAGILYACRSLHFTYDRMGGTPYDRLRRIVSGVAVELAVRRCLGELGVPFDVRGATPFSDPDRYDIALGGHRCDLKTFLLTEREQIRDVKRAPELLLEAPALVPLDQLRSGRHSDQDLYLFAFLSGLVTRTQDEIRQAQEAGSPTFLIHALPGAWARPRTWAPLDGLALKSEAGRPLTVELDGQAGDREFITRRVELPPKKRISLPAEFHTLAYAHVEALPEARIGIHVPALGEAHIIAPGEWGNIRVYGMAIVLAGYLSHGEFARRSLEIPAGSQVFQYRRTRTRNMAVPLARLRPLRELFERVKEWERGRGGSV